MLLLSACGKPAEKRCSRCKLEWYCSRFVRVNNACYSSTERQLIPRDCQVAAWKEHKKLCDVMVAAQAEDGKAGAAAKEKENVARAN